jgi:hypothetical protein
MDDRPEKMAIDLNGNVYVTGTVQTTTEGSNIMTVKYSSDGILQWAIPYNQSSNINDFASSLITDSIGNIYVLGYTGYNLGPYDIVTIKYSSNGTQQWAKIYNGTSANTDDTPGNLAIDNIGNVYVCGSAGDQNGQGNAFLIKYNSFGDSVWVKRYFNGVHYAGFGDIILDRLGNIYVTGNTSIYLGFPTTVSRTSCLTAQYDSSGVLLWSALSNDTQNYVYEGSVGIALDSSRNIFITGSTSNTNSTSSFLTIKYSNSGAQLWRKIYSGPIIYSSAVNVWVDRSNNAYVTGNSAITSNNVDFLTIKYDSNGDSIWVRRYGGPTNGGSGSLATVIDDSSNIYITGSNSTGMTSFKYSKDGNQLWTVSYPGLSKDIGIDRQQNIFVSGANADSGNGFDYLTIKYSQFLGINPISNIVPDKFRLYQNYPNPFNPSTKLKFQVAKLSYIQLIIYDITGREVKDIVSETLHPGIYESVWDASLYASGIYFYKMIAENFIQSKKMILVK